METAVLNNESMAKKPAKRPDRHKPAGYIRLPLSVLAELDKLVDRNASDRTEEVRIAVLERLKAEGLWPPK
jgi:hypothetical protein